jgi:hypothetical protein
MIEGYRVIHDSMTPLWFGAEWKQIVVMSRSTPSGSAIKRGERVPAATCVRVAEHRSCYPHKGGPPAPHAFVR